MRLKQFLLGQTSKKQKRSLTCEIHFKRLPIELETVSLVEGRRASFQTKSFELFRYSIEKILTEELKRMKPSKLSHLRKKG